MSFERGEPKGKIEVVGETDHTGTTIRFKPDPEIFTETTVFNYDTLKKRLRELAFLNRKLTITLEDRRDPEKEKETFYYEGGIKEFVEFVKLVQNRFARADLRRRRRK